MRIDKKADSDDNNNFVVQNNNFFHVGVDGGAEDTGIYINSGMYGGSIGVNATGNWWDSTDGPSVDGPGTGIAIRAFGNPITINPWSSTPVINQQRAWWGLASDVTSPIQFEGFDHGGDQIAYNDQTTGNTWDGLHHYDEVDINTTADTGGGFVVGDTKNGEWIEYTVDIHASGMYTLTTRVAHNN